MAKIYYKRILADEMTLEEVPVRWRAQVANMLNGNMD